MIKAGDTYLFPSIPGGYDHLYFVLLDPDESGFTVVANATSNKSYKPDQTTLLSSGEHVSITRASVIVYREAQLILASSIEQKINKGDVILGDKCSRSLLERIKEGLLKSPYTKRGLKEYFKKRS